MDATRTWRALLVVGWLLLPTAAWAADPEVWLVVGPIATADGFGPSDDAFRPAAGAVMLHERDVVPMPTCDAPLTFGLRPAPDASARQLISVRLLKRRTASGCALDVLTVGTTPRRGKTPTTSGTSNLPLSNDGLRRENARDLPCGTRLIVLREGSIGGYSGSLPGLGPNGDCTDRGEDMLSPIGIHWLASPSAPHAGG